MKLFYSVCIWVFLLSVAFAGSDKIIDMRVEFDEAQVNRSTKPDSSWNFMDVNLNLTGDGLKNAKWYYDPVYTRVDTESGSLLKTDEYWKVERLWRLKELDKNNNNKFRLWQRFKVPQRDDKTLSIEGYAEVYIPRGEDNTVEISDYLSKSKKPVESPLFKNNRIECFYLTKDDLANLRDSEATESQTKKSAEAVGKAFAESFAQLFKDMFGISDNDLTFFIKSDKDQILNILLINEKGEVMEPSSRSVSRDDNGRLRYGLKFKKMMPQKGKIKIIIDDSDSIRKIPFKYQVQLP